LQQVQVQVQVQVQHVIALTSLVRPFLESGELAGELSKSNNYIVELNNSAFYQA
jgi:hypothetical protein